MSFCLLIDRPAVSQCSRERTHRHSWRVGYELEDVDRVRHLPRAAGSVPILLQVHLRGGFISVPLSPQQYHCFLIFVSARNPLVGTSKKRRYDDAMKSLLTLRNSRLQAARELFYMHAQLE